MSDAGPSTGSAALAAKRADDRRKRNRERMGIPEKDKTGRNVEQSVNIVHCSLLTRTRWPFPVACIR
ncbi:hypothetical protein M407DRAFT_240536 [Tulasnella calospora MUT 4182]|uniref:Uncharacterized protein n=1 Tax=Tulasnella calospora MUT 4182 TaxID=1051891 RepID=A0A0C3LKR5_9AGAM|nr:hypothetical protein M407DRAFT_240536 [Tulasnella calospora MUT 4182]